MADLPRLSGWLKAFQLFHYISQQHPKQGRIEMNSRASKRKWYQKITLLFAVTICLSGCDWIARIPEVRIIKKDGSMVKVQVEVARKPAERNLGLMYRKSLGKNKGMLFVFDE